MNDRVSATPSSTNPAQHVPVGNAGADASASLHSLDRLLTHDEFDRALKAAARTYPVDIDTLVREARMELAGQSLWWWQRCARLWRKLRLSLFRLRP